MKEKMIEHNMKEYSLVDFIETFTLIDNLCTEAAIGQFVETQLTSLTLVERIFQICVMLLN